MFYSTISTRPNTHLSPTRTEKEGAGYRKPSNVAVGERFYIKVQGNGPKAPLMVYDKTREFNITVAPGSRGHEQLWKAVKAEPTWQGRKTFVEASFDIEGNCIVYPGKTSIRKW